MSALAVSQIQKHFITNQIYKRSKRYFDVIKLKSIQSHNSKSRRKPNQSERQQVEKKFNSSFMSSQDFYSKRRIEQIQKSKKKNYSTQLIDDKDQIQTNVSVITRKLVPINTKGFDMGKLLSRQFYQKQNQTYASIQDPFDNFVISDFTKGQKGKSIDFNKILGRKGMIQKKNYLRNGKDNLQIDNPQSTGLKLKHDLKSYSASVNINQIYEKIAFDQTKFKVLFDVDKQRKAQNRKAINTSLKFDQPKQIQLQRIQKGRQFSRKKPVPPTSLMFYHGKGKQEPSQIHYKTLKKNQNYWLEQLKIMKKQDFETAKRRQQMIQKRNSQIRAKKHIIDQRGQICDAKYFLRLREDNKNK